jgi:hypothetical protein
LYLVACAAPAAADAESLVRLAQDAGWRVCVLTSPMGQNVQVLRSMGVRVLFDPAAPPDARMPTWEAILGELHALLDG